MSTKAGQRICAGLLLAIFLGIAALATALGKSDSQNNATRIQAIGKLQDWQRNKFALLRNRPEGLPREIRGPMQGTMLRLNPELAQRLPARRQHVWAVPGDRVICLVVREASGFFGRTCGSVKRTLERGLAVTVLGDRDNAGSQFGRTIVGIAPDQVTHVVARAPGGALKIAVNENVFVHSDAIEEPPRQFTLVQSKPSS